MSTPHTTRRAISNPHHDANMLAIDEVRRSGRANKGHHTKNADALDEPVAVKPKSKSKTDKKSKDGANTAAARSQSAPSEEADENQESDNDDDIRCVCGIQKDYGPEMIACDSCGSWQHNKCLRLPDARYWETITYYCEQCKPEYHQDLLTRMAKGEKPWLKWNKKGTKMPKSRPEFEAKPGGKAEKANTATSQPSQTAATSPAATQSDAPSPAVSAPVAAPTETAADGHTVKAEIKVCRGFPRNVEPSDIL